MYRKVNKYLNDWKLDKNRKVLLVRGARQVGKTYSVRELGKSFPYFIEVNFEEEPQIGSFFESSLNPEAITIKLAAFYNVPIVPGQTLLFFDEIQNCPNAIKSLRFFFEKMPQLHVVAAGSLLEFALADLSSFGVGRIASLFMYPFSFEEFVISLEGEAMAQIIRQGSPDNPLDEIFHNKLFELLKIYKLTGGMPEVIRYYTENKDLRKCQTVISNLVTSFQDDFVKYQQKIDANILREVFISIMEQGGNKFKFSNISNDYKIYHYKNALSYIINAGLAYKVHHTSSHSQPLGARIDSKKFKILPFDIGVYQRMTGLNLSEYLLKSNEDLATKGNLAELFAGLQLIYCSSPLQKPELHYWHRESKASNAEVDYIISRGQEIVPLEVKSGSRGQMQSMQRYMDEHNSKTGIRVSHENFGRVGKIDIYPLYAVGNLVEY